MTFTICLLIFLIICHSPSNDSNYFIKNASVDTIFYLPSICMLDPEKSKNIIFSPWGRENIQNSVVRPVRASEHLKCLFQLKWPKCPWLALGLTKGQTRSKLSQNNVFHSFTPNSSFSNIFNNFDQVWPEVNPRWAQKP